MTEFSEITQRIATQDSIKHFADYFDDGKVLIKNAFDECIPAITNILEWCDVTMPHMNQVINGNDDSQSQVTTKLDDGVQKLRIAQKGISSSVSNFNPAIGSTGTLLYQIVAELKNKTNEITRENRQIYKYLKSKIKNLNTDATDFKLQFKDDMQIIADLRMQTENVQTFLSLHEYSDFHDEIHESVEKLISQCNKYRRRYE